MKKEIILHIEDEESNRYLVKRILEKTGFKVVQASTGKDGLKLATEIMPDLIILDINLPDTNGFEVCKIIKSNLLTSSIPILQTSASYVSTENKVTGLNSGADGYLTQPLEGNVLIATVNSLLRIKSAEKKAIKATHARDEMLAIVSHDLRTPLSFIMLQSRILRNQIADGKFVSEVAIEKLNKISDSCHRMNRLIMDLMDISQIDEGKFSVSMQTMSTQFLINDINHAFEELVADAKISFSVKPLTDDISFEGDKDRLLQMIGNLITNAVKFTEPGGRIDLSFVTKDHDLCVHLSDSGKGIDPKDLENIFNRYWQENYERRDGIGLGLSIVKGIVDAHNGKIHLTSELGRGTTFTIQIPLFRKSLTTP